MKSVNKLMGFFFVLSLVAFASCNKNESNTNVASGFNQPAAVEAIDYSKPYIEILTAPKDYYSVEASGRVYTSRGLLYSQILTQVTLTKFSQRNIATFSLEESESEYRVKVVRIKSTELDAKLAKEICTSDPDELSRWVLEATLEGKTVKICFDKERGMWYGYIVEE